MERTVCDIEGAHDRFSPFEHARGAHFRFFLHILHETAQTEVHAENQRPRFPGSDSNDLGRADGQTYIGSYREAPPLNTSLGSGLKVCGGGGGGGCKTKYSDQHRPRVELNNLLLLGCISLRKLWDISFFH